MVGGPNEAEMKIKMKKTKAHANHDRPHGDHDRNGRNTKNFLIESYKTSSGVRSS